MVFIILIVSITLLTSSILIIFILIFIILILELVVEFLIQLVLKSFHILFIVWWHLSISPLIDAHLNSFNKICSYSKTLPFPFNILEGILNNRLQHHVRIFDIVFVYQYRMTQIPHEWFLGMDPLEVGDSSWTIGSYNIATFKHLCQSFIIK